MPQGKGTYGSQKGRPPENKKNYQDGGEVGGIAPPISSEVEEPFQDHLETGIPMLDARERSQVSYQLGGEVQPPTAPSIQPANYDKGGLIKKVVEKYKSKKAERKREKARKKSVEDFPITSVVQPKPKKKGLKPAVVPSNPPLFKGGTAKEKIIHAIPGLSKTPAGKRGLKNKTDIAGKNKKQKVAPKGGHALEPARITKGRKKTKQWV